MRPAVTLLAVLAALAGGIGYGFWLGRADLHLVVSWSAENGMCVVKCPMAGVAGVQRIRLYCGPASASDPTAWRVKSP